METRQYAIGDVITMQLMRREKGVLIALPKSQWMNVVQPVHVGGECLSTGAWHPAPNCGLDLAKDFPWQCHAAVLK